MHIKFVDKCYSWWRKLDCLSQELQQVLSSVGLKFDLKGSFWTRWWDKKKVFKSGYCWALLFSSYLFLVGEPGLVVQTSLPCYVHCPRFFGLKNGLVERWKVMEIGVGNGRMFKSEALKWTFFLEENLSTWNQKSTVCSFIYAKSFSSSLVATHVMWNISLNSTKVNHCGVMKQKVSLQIMIRRQELVCYLFSVLWAVLPVVVWRLSSVWRNAP